jgi:NADPH:quinone reductase-like Zn-dependent oxidoreductase
MNDFITAHGIKPVIDKSFAFEEAQAAYDHLASGKHFGKIVITFGAGS